LTRIFIYRPGSDITNRILDAAGCAGIALRLFPDPGKLTEN
jgi:hypothetical protein